MKEHIMKQRLNHLRDSYEAKQNKCVKDNDLAFASYYRGKVDLIDDVLFYELNDCECE